MPWPPLRSPHRPPLATDQERDLLHGLQGALNRAQVASDPTARDDAFRSVRFFARRLPDGEPQTDGNKLTDYSSDQWWVAELHKLRNGHPVTDDTKRAVAVVERLVKLLDANI